MKKFCKLLGVIAIGAVIAIGLAGCENPTTNNPNNNNNGDGNNGNGGDGGGLSGTWGGNVGGYSVTVVINASGWTLSAPGAGFSDYGTYTMTTGISASLYSTQYNLNTGTATLINSSTISVYLNASSIAPGTHTLTR
jgi:hypothetical protein